ncbi:putative AC9 transposase [Aphis craccivora]|uniref:Putative AC9 transposase n=1 Tax=Aphis craccivora TaxID=307492 RepID=A0A6G0Z6J2_APHCR|nr:putative AC9 transposase [Aphis craccivora]
MSQDDTIFKNIQPLVSALLTGIDKRFGDLLQNKFLIIASMSNLCFKVAWIKNDVRKQMTMDAFRTACLQLMYEKECVSNTQEPNIVESNDESSLDFFTWSSSNNMNGKN